jgi:hypothetical protein
MRFSLVFMVALLGFFAASAFASPCEHRADLADAQSASQAPAGSLQCANPGTAPDTPSTLRIASSLTNAPEPPGPAMLGVLGVGVLGIWLATRRSRKTAS